MEAILAPDTEPPIEDRVRALGFEPAHLTPQEQEELLEIHARCPDELVAV